MPKSEEQCRQMREDMRSKILKMSSLYFAKTGFGDTRICDLAKHIGIGQMSSGKAGRKAQWWPGIPSFWRRYSIVI